MLSGGLLLLGVLSVTSTGDPEIACDDLSRPADASPLVGTI